jgi:hypothetical protein
VRRKNKLMRKTRKRRRRFQNKKFPSLSDCYKLIILFNPLSDLVYITLSYFYDLLLNDTQLNYYILKFTVKSEGLI